jgi:hypothetical protein
MMVFLGFLKALPSKLWGYLTVVAGMVAALAYFYFSTKNKGKVEAETKAEIEEAQAGEARAKVITKTITEDAKVVAEIKKEIDALPPSDITARASKWVRNKPGASN